MSRSLMRMVQKRKLARGKIKDVFKNLSDSVVVHYACDSFQQNESAHISCIGVKELNINQTKTFSIQHYAELQNIAIKTMTIEQKDDCEYLMLLDFWKFVKKINIKIGFTGE